MLDSGYTSVDGRVLAKPGTALGPGQLLFARSVSDNRFLFGLVWCHQQVGRAHHDRPQTTHDGSTTGAATSFRPLETPP